MKFSIKDFFSKRDQITFTEEMLNGKLNFLYSFLFYFIFQFKIFQILLLTYFMPLISFDTP